ncbi:MAG: hypothetical protein EZS28_000851 [Streblomastix strix]|uniref:Uncharacterized protein n=1 Tax=Streblomastix strix TaxID=222440 RepID=A0A5J4XAT9_9EUKA|nr:MAG: hypothetical protein EZS28_000851 [Streblomastix strix]
MHQTGHGSTGAMRVASTVVKLTPASVDDYIQIIASKHDAEIIAALQKLLIECSSSSSWDIIPSNIGRLFPRLTDLFIVGNSEMKRICVRIIEQTPEKDISEDATTSLCELVEKSVQTSSDLEIIPIVLNLAEEQLQQSPSYDSNLFQKKVLCSIRVLTSAVTVGVGKYISASQYQLIEKLVDDKDDNISIAANNFLHMWKRKKLDVPKTIDKSEVNKEDQSELTRQLRRKDQEIKRINDENKKLQEELQRVQEEKKKAEEEKKLAEIRARREGRRAQNLEKKASQLEEKQKMIDELQILSPSQAKQSINSPASKQHSFQDFPVNSSPITSPTSYNFPSRSPTFSSQSSPYSSTLSKRSDDIHFQLENTYPTKGQVELFEEIMRKVTALIRGYISVPIDFTVSDGIIQCDFRFQNSSKEDGRSVGIVKSSYIIPYPCDTSYPPQCNHMLEYYGNEGIINHKMNSTEGNKEFQDDNHIIRMELNYNKGTLHFFLDQIQQPVFVRGIKEPVKFFGCLFYPNTSFIVESLRRLGAPRAVSMENEIPVEW